MTQITRFKGAAAFTDPAGTSQFPFIPTIDPVESLGSLMLIEPARSGISAAPASGTTVAPNLLRTFAKATVGSGALADFDGVYDVFGLSGSKGLVELTSKKGIHGIVSLTASDSAAYNFIVASPAAIFNYIKANPSHRFYHSIMGRITRVATPGSSYTINGQLMAFAYDTLAHNQTVNAPDGSRPAVNTVGPAFRNAGTFISGSAPASYSTANNTLFNVGNKGMSGGNWGKGGSHVFYRTYVEDLTVSGRTYAAVDAIENAYYTKEVLTAGGRYFGDTFTDPATIA
jgi:hypothetical protein